MKIFTTRKEILAFLSEQRLQGKRIGFVPTMGALHQGHLSLIETSKNSFDLTICSIFVNPTQFNDPKDLEKYPRPIDVDIEKLTNANCNVLFLPNVQEMYRENETWKMELGDIENILEGKFRPNHYQGVTQIVSKFFELIKPDVAFFGQKDFQQYLVIKAMVDKLKLSVELVLCPIVREADGLAMSSRNVNLSNEERQHALALSKVLFNTKDNFEERSLDQLREDARSFLEHSEGLKLEYFEITEAKTLRPATTKNGDGLVALVAAFVGKTRLIDNLILK